MFVKGPEGFSAALAEYLRLEVERERLGSLEVDWQEEDDLLDGMDRVWWSLTGDEQRWLKARRRG